MFSIELTHTFGEDGLLATGFFCSTLRSFLAVKKSNQIPNIPVSFSVLNTVVVLAECSGQTLVGTFTFSIVGAGKTEGDDSSEDSNEDSIESDVDMVDGDVDDLEAAWVYFAVTNRTW